MNRIPFVIVDWNNHFAKVKFENLIPMHGKYIHVLLASPDTEDVYHLHPDDFGDLKNMSDTGACKPPLRFLSQGIQSGSMLSFPRMESGILPLLSCTRMEAT